MTKQILTQGYSERGDRKKYRARAGVQEGTLLHDMNRISDAFVSVSEVADIGPEGLHGQGAMKYGISPKAIKSSQVHLKSLGYDIGKTGADKKWSTLSNTAFQEYKKHYFLGYTDEEIKKMNAYNKKVRDFLEKRAKSKSTEDKIIDGMLKSSY